MKYFSSCDETEGFRSSDVENSISVTLNLNRSIREYKWLRLVFVNEKKRYKRECMRCHSYLLIRQFRFRVTKREKKKKEKSWKNGRFCR